MKHLPVLLFLFSIIFPVYSFEAYISRSIIHENKPLTVGDLISVYPQTDGLTVTKEIPSLGPNPALLSLMEIKSYLTGTGIESGVLVGKRPVYIPGSVKTVQERNFYTQLLDFLNTVFPDQNERVEVELLNASFLPVSGTDEKLTFRVEETAPLVVYLTCTAGNGDILRYNVQYKRSVPVYVSKKYIPAGSLLEKNDLYLKFIEKENLSATPEYLQIDGAVWYAARTINSGVPLLKQHVTVNEMVNKGESISIIIERGSLVMKLEGRTLEAGEVGSEIRVKPLRGAREISGILSGNNEVRVD